MSIKFNSRSINLQLFAEGSGTGDGGAMGVTGEAATSQTKGVKNPLADVKYGVQPDAQVTAVQDTETVETPPDRNAEFKKLIKGEYKEQYDAEVQDIVQKRLKSTKETVETMAILLFRFRCRNSPLLRQLRLLTTRITSHHTIYPRPPRMMSIEVTILISGLVA